MVVVVVAADHTQSSLAGLAGFSKAKYLSCQPRVPHNQLRLFFVFFFFAGDRHGRSPVLSDHLLSCVA
ncbi:unnamed protein product [Nippostrongylus brasiliensis]|uniref:Transposase n=1 Tax=Nippostrongylus brasiliensis TaxID=27835 RepID=A0A0N4YRX0_NIPBR|nr:unnamed protein product [Nippostrongylus brasiliensis]